jgi:TRAP-type mannitol/chloroaromatic compound transport system permease small subunit
LQKSRFREVANRKNPQITTGDKVHSTASPDSDGGYKTEQDLLPREEMPERGPWGRRLLVLSKAFALAGGTLLVALVVMSVASIVGRKLFSMPVPGDIEIMQMGTAVAAAALLPYCEMLGKHLRVDFFTAHLRAGPKAVLDGIANLLLGFVGALVAWRTAAYTISIWQAGETSMVLGWPVWPATALIVPSLIMFALAGWYNAMQKFASASGSGRT